MGFMKKHEFMDEYVREHASPYLIVAAFSIEGNIKMAHDTVPSRDGMTMVDNAHLTIDADGFGEKITVRTHEGDLYELVEYDKKFSGMITTYKEDGFKDDGSKKYRFIRVPMDADSIKEYVSQDYLARAFNHVIYELNFEISDDEKGVEITYNDLVDKIDEFNDKNAKSEVFVYTAKNWNDRGYINLKSYLVSDVIETMAYKYGKDIVSSFAAERLSDLSERTIQGRITEKYAKEYGVDFSECDNVLQAQAKMEVNGCKWSELPEVKNFLDEIIKEHTGQTKER